MKKIDKSIVICAIICISLLEAFALYQGVNGAMLRIVLIILALIAGVVIPTPKALTE